MAAKRPASPAKRPTPPVGKPVSAKPAAPRSREVSPRAAAEPYFFLPDFWRQGWLPVLLLVVCAFALYAAAIPFNYVLDDQMVVWNNQYVMKGLSGLSGIFSHDSFMGFFGDEKKLSLLEGGRYRPLSLATFALEVSLFGAKNPNLPHISHFINILLYGLTGGLLYRILWGLFPLRMNSDPSAHTHEAEPRASRWYFSVAFLAALFFIFHSLHTEVVANVKGRDEILALLGGLGALWAALKYYDARRGVWLGVAAVSLLLGMLAKENALTFLAVVPLTVWFFRPANAGAQAGRPGVFNILWPLLLAAFAFILIRFNALGYMVSHGKPSTDLMNNPFLGMSPGDRLATTFLTLGWYIKLLFWPHPLTHDYYPYHVPRVGWSDWRALGSLALYLALGIWAALNLRRRKVPAYAIAFYLLTLSIVSNVFVSVGTFMNERFLYMPSVGFCLLLGWFLARQLPVWLKGEMDRPGILSAGMVAIALALGAWGIVTRVPDWKDKLSLNASAAHNSPNSARAHCFYAVSLYEKMNPRSASGDTLDYWTPKEAANMTPEEKLVLLDTIEYHLLQATKINPNYGSAWQMLPGVAASRFDAQAQLHREKKSDKGPQMDRLFNDFTYTLEHAPQNKEALRYTEAYLAYLAGNGGNPNKIVGFAYHIGYEFYYKQRNEPQTGLRYLEAAAKMQWPDERLYAGMAEIYGKMGDAAKAAEYEQRAAAAKAVDMNQ